MSSQIPQIGEYQSMAHRKLGPPVPNVAPIVPEGSHSLTSPNGLYNLFSFSPLIRCPMYHLFLSALFMSPNSQTGACTQPVSLASTQGDQIIRFNVINRECVGIRTFYPSSFDHT